MDNHREIQRVLKSKPTMEGAGVHLKRAFGYHDPSLDPFLLLDDFHSDNPEDYVAGFPWHPHRGIETITYMLHGEVAHGDSLGNKGLIREGDVQWMTAGSGIIHEEMPHQSQGLLWGFQLWANLPSSHKMMPPRYRNIKKEQIPQVSISNDVLVRVICGEIGGVKGPVQDIVTNPEYLDVTAHPGSEFNHLVRNGHNVFAYVIEGEGYFDQSKDELIGSEHLVIFEDGDRVRIRTENEKVRFLLISGKPIGEPVAWYGPIVMNTQEELRIAFEEYQNGTFIKH
ncbi:MAG: pirin family protein [Candidatus Hydrothermarchaeales archaeon]